MAFELIEEHLRVRSIQQEDRVGLCLIFIFVDS